MTRSSRGFGFGLVLVAVLGGCLLAPLGSLAKPPTLRSGIYSSCDTNCTSVSYVNAFVFGKPRLPKMGVGSHCTSFLHSDFKVPINRKGRFKTHHTFPAAGGSDEERVRIRGRVAKATKIVGHARQVTVDEFNMVTCSVSFDFVARAAS